MLKEKEKQEELSRQNLNPWTFEYAIKNNMSNCMRWARKHDKFWHGKYE